MDPISAVCVAPKLERVVPTLIPVETAQGRITVLFVKTVPVASEEAATKHIQKKATHLKKELVEHGEGFSTLPPQVIQEILAPKENKFFLDVKGEISFHFESAQAQIVIKGWDRYIEHLCEEAILKKASERKYQRRKEQLESQKEKARIEKEEIAKQELRLVS